jgi:two-component system response regulator FixJ
MTVSVQTDSILSGPKQHLPVVASDHPDRPEASTPSDGVASRIEAAEVVLIDDDPSVLQGLLLLFAEEGLSPVGFSDPLDALMWASDADPTCIVVDLKLPGIDGLDLVAALCAVGRHCIILMSAYVDVGTTVEAMRLGVDNVLQKPADAEMIVAAARRGIAQLASSPNREIITFTRRERQVAEHILVGRTTKQIAQLLSLSPRTVEFFRASLLRKTQSPNTAALASNLTRIGFTTPAPDATAPTR